jgi:hypothetical protein
MMSAAVVSSRDEAGDLLAMFGQLGCGILISRERDLQQSAADDLQRVDRRA